MAIYRIRHEHRRNDLISARPNTNPNDGRNIPVHAGRLLQAHAKNNQPNDDEHEAKVGDPQPVLWRRPQPVAELLGLAVEPPVAEGTAELLADDGADDHAEELEAQLLRVEAEFRDEDLRDFDGEEDGDEAEGYGVGDCGDEDGGVFCEEGGLDEFDGTESCRV